jgi:hypothetical protein
MFTRRWITYSFVLFLLMTVPVTGLSQSEDTDFRQLPLETLEAFRPTGENWQVAGHVVADRRHVHDLTAAAGTGVLVNLPTARAQSNLFSDWEHGDLRLEMDVMVPRGSNSGIYLQGRYEIQILDSWDVESPDYGDMGGIYQRWDASRPEGNRGYRGKPPRENVARAPGLWQHLTIEFQAPRFDADGKKVKNAVFREVTLNGVTIHENVEVTGPTRGAAFEGEVPRGRIMIQGDHGPVAFRNIRYQRPEHLSSARPESTAEQQEPNPMFLEPSREPRVLRSYMFHRGRKRMHVVSVGDASGIHYAYDLDRGGLLKMWKGPFLEVTEMWHGRGIEQVAEPRGSVISRTGAPDAAFLADRETAWPDSLAPDTDFEYVGYELNSEGWPTFEYRLQDARITAESFPFNGSRVFVRSLTF